MSSSPSPVKVLGARLFLSLPVLVLASALVVKTHVGLCAAFSPACYPSLAAT